MAVKSTNIIQKNGNNPNFSKIKREYLLLLVLLPIERKKSGYDLLEKMLINSKNEKNFSSVVVELSLNEKFKKIFMIFIQNS